MNNDDYTKAMMDSEIAALFGKAKDKYPSLTNCSDCSLVKKASEMVMEGLSNYSRRDLERFVQLVSDGRAEAVTPDEV